MVKPLIFLFKDEYKGTEFRKSLNEKAGSKEYKGKIGKVVLDTLEEMKKMNPEAL
jgi:hypothetical protein